MSDEKSALPSIQETAAKLQAMAKNTDRRNKFARFRELAPSIEAALGAGIKYETVREQLSADGLDLSVGTFRTYLSRVRLAKSQSRQKQQDSPPAPTPDRKESQQETDGNESASWNPQTLSALRNNPVDLSALARAAKKQPKG